MDSSKENENDKDADLNTNYVHESLETILLTEIAETEIGEMGIDEPLVTDHNSMTHEEEGDESPKSSAGMELHNRFGLDENNNIRNLKIMGPKKEKKLFKKFSRSRFHGVMRNFQVMNIFTDFGSWFRKKPPPPPRAGVHFPDEIVEAAEAREITGIGYREIKTQKHFRPLPRHKLKPNSLKLSPNGEEFRPRIARIENTNCLAVCCERSMVGGLSLTPFQPEFDYGRYMKKKQHSDIPRMEEDLMYCITKAEDFLEQHNNSTGLFEALQALDIKIPASDVGEGDAGSDNDLHELTNSRIGKPAVNIWIVTYCISTLLFSDEKSPSDTGFLNLMHQLSAFEIGVYDAISELIPQSKDFYNFAKEVMRVLQIIQYQIQFEAEFSISKPIDLGHGLDIHSFKPQSHSSTKFQINIMVARTTESPLEWINFEELNGHDKIAALKCLLISTKEEFDIGNREVNLLVCDIRETAYRPEDNVDVLYQVGEIYDALDNINMQPQDEEKASFCNRIPKTMTDFANLFNTLVVKCQHIMKRIMEVRDMLQICYDHLQNAEHIDVRRVASNSKNLQPASKSGSCCRSRQPILINEKQLKLPHYKDSDFFRVYYEDASFCPVIKAADGFLFQLRKSTAKSSEVQKKPAAAVRWSNSDPTHNTTRVSNTDSINGVMITQGSQESVAFVEPEHFLKPILVNKTVSSVTIPVLENLSDPDVQLIRRTKGKDSLTKH